jgi:acyl-CoA hydrolase
MTEITNAATLDLSRHIKPGDHIVIGQACGEPQTLVEALIAQGKAIGGLHAFIATSFSGLFTPESANSFSLSSMGAIGALRTMTKAGKLSIIPCHVGQIGPMIEAGIIGCDVAFVQVSPADADGNHSFGLISDHVQAMIAKARIIIAEVNDQIPYTYGEAVLPSSRIDVAVHVSRAPVQVLPATASQTDEAIARTIANYVEDGTVLQVGVGAIPDAVMRLLTDRKDLGVHSGMIGDGYVDLVEAGVMTNARKPFDQGIGIAGALIGSKRLFDHANQNKSILMCSAAITHAEAVLVQIPKLVTINSALEIDLTGQVNAEGSGSAYMGGTGGQVDYVRAGSRSPGGHSVIALSATAKGGSISKIVAQLNGPVTTARADVDVILTEYGAAELKGQSISERARRMVAIAHPDFREELDKAAFEIRQRGF